MTEENFGTKCPRCGHEWKEPDWRCPKCYYEFGNEVEPPERTESTAGRNVVTDTNPPSATEVAELHVAVANNELQVVKHKLSDGRLTPDVRNEWDFTPLHSAISAGLGDMVDLLLALGGSHEAVAYRKPEDGGYRRRFCLLPIHLAALRGDEGIVASLLSAGADPDSVDQAGETALHYIARWPVVRDGKQVEKDKTACIQALLKSGASANAVDTQGVTPLMTLAIFGAREMWDFAKMDVQSVAQTVAAIVAAFADHGADLSLVDKQGRSLATFASSFKNDAIHSALLGREAPAQLPETEEDPWRVFLNANREYISGDIEDGTDYKVLLHCHYPSYSHADRSLSLINNKIASRLTPVTEAQSDETGSLRYHVAHEGVLRGSEIKEYLLTVDTAGGKVFEVLL